LGIRVFEDDLPDGVSAAIVNNASSGATIVISRGDATNRKRFSCAHEIGHFVRHTNELDEAEYSYVDFRNQVASTGVDKEEVYANTFAASLLMPEKLVRKFVNEKMSPTDMVVKFGVSSMALANRMNALGLN
jgi:Zn-dependent peptidase ImmA (M78 family)